jgi:hypothetical protein
MFWNSYIMSLVYFYYSLIPSRIWHLAAGKHICFYHTNHFLQKTSPSIPSLTQKLWIHVLSPVPRSSTDTIWLPQHGQTTDFHWVFCYLAMKSPSNTTTLQYQLLLLSLVSSTTFITVVFSASNTISYLFCLLII